jgi:steroid 5-alpha reductase family enzyme
MLIFYFLSLAMIFVYMSTVFAVAILKKDNSIVDIAYGPAFIVSGSLLAFLASLEAPLSQHTVVMLLFIYIWGIRLAIRIYAKNKERGEEDFRYKVWRTLWMAHGKAYFYIRSCLQIFVLQGFVVSIVLLPLTLSLVEQKSPFISLSLFGMLLWIVGFFFESVGDAQLDTFIKRKRYLKEKIMKTGLWKYTRHPNYFGESTMWWGIAFVAFSLSGNAIVFLSPILITYLLLYVSGIPMLERKWSGDLEWEMYKAKTSPFLPLPPKQIEQ